jgi:hypothetical protein
LQDLSIDGRIVLKLISNNLGGLGLDLFGLRIKRVGGLLWKQ